MFWVCSQAELDSPPELLLIAKPNYGFIGVRLHVSVCRKEILFLCRRHSVMLHNLKKNLFRSDGTVFYLPYWLLVLVN